ncbi:MAG: hypothetical protein JWL65_980 [Gammaproteobacteria bacterium]|nr:hypothetical protein [Gammaproteobacteria bacterium]
MEVEPGVSYSCVWCGAPSLHGGPGELRCDNCSRSYPIIDEIPILVLRPRALLGATVNALHSTDSQTRQLAAVLANVTSSNAVPSLTRVRAERALQGMAANCALVGDHMKAAERLLQGPAAAPGLLDTISNCGGGWSVDAMFPYFYQDWGATGEFEKVKTLTLAALRRHRPDSDAVAILGAGACGLVKTVAAEFDHTYGIDLSVPTLLIARSVLSGRPIVVHLENAEWSRVQVRSSEPAKQNIRLIAADVANLPMPDRTLSAVVTQYLMDIVGNPSRVAREIHRVLKPGGVWVNFSLPMRTTIVPQEFGCFGLAEMPGFLGSVGFQLLESREERFSLLNLEKISKAATTVAHSVHFFTARRQLDVTASNGNNCHGIAVRDDDAWWRSVPRFTSGRTAEIASVVEYCSDLRKRRFDVSFGLVRLPASEGTIPRYALDADDANRLNAFLGLIDGTRTNREIYHTLLAQGVRFSGADFRELCHYLSDRYGLVGSVD